MAGQRRERPDQAQGKIKELEARLAKLEDQLKVLQGQAREARGQARIRLTRLEKNAAGQVARMQAAFKASRDRLTESLERATRLVEPRLQGSVSQGRRLLRISAAEARLLSRGLKAGVKASREALRRSRRRP